MLPASKHRAGGTSRGGKGKGEGVETQREEGPDADRLAGRGTLRNEPAAAGRRDRVRGGLPAPSEAGEERTDPWRRERERGAEGEGAAMLDWRVGIFRTAVDRNKIIGRLAELKLTRQVF